jgi:pumilio family protein 6
VLDHRRSITIADRRPTNTMAAAAAVSKTSHKGKSHPASDSHSKKRKYDGSAHNNKNKSDGYRGGSHNAKNNPDSTQTPCNKKRALKAERQSHRKHAPVVRSAKTIWNELRIKTNDKETNDRLCAELHDILRGKCMEVAMQHDASRCVQGVLQFGNEVQRREVVTELCGAGGGGRSNDDDGKGKKNDQKMNLAELCKIQYAHFVVLKMIKYCARDEVCVKMIVKVSVFQRYYIVE